MGMKAGKPTGNDKTSIVCAVKDRPGALLAMLKPFQRCGDQHVEDRVAPRQEKDVGV